MGVCSGDGILPETLAVFSGLHVVAIPNLEMVGRRY
jgi:hypothetical protein